MKVSMHIFAAYVPIMFGTLKTAWRVLPLLLLNALIEGVAIGAILPIRM